MSFSVEKYDHYRVTFTGIKWDADPHEYSADVIATLPKNGSIIVEAPDSNCAYEWGMSDYSDNLSFCIAGHEKVVVEKYMGPEPEKVWLNEAKNYFELKFDDDRWKTVREI